MINNIELLKRLYATAASGKWDDPELAGDTLSYISQLEHTIQENGPGEIRYSQLLLDLGRVLGMLAVPRLRENLITSIHDGSLQPLYIVALRDRLTSILAKAGVEAVR